MKETDTALQQMWDERYRAAMAEAAAPAQVVKDFVHLLPGSGAALDLACGLGGNAVFLAQRGLATHAWDLSAVAIAKLRQHAERMHLDIRADLRDVATTSFPHEAFDVIVVARFLERELAPAIMQALRPGGLLFYQTYIRDAVSATGPKNPEFRLARNELLHLFSGLAVLVYREEGCVGDVSAGFRDEAMLVAMKV